ncbi:MAG TPA: glutamine-hydrolyzing GMP synthase [Fibrobacteria bacterium]|nr:glutamine-hydrolyzing GMP synthase [Fibrobacteria bacterium]
MEKVGVIDLGGQYTHLIARRVRQLGVYSEVLPALSGADQLKGFSGLILSGGPSSVYDAEAPTVGAAVLDAGLPILGLCYGHQLICDKLGGKVERGSVHEFGPADFHPDRSHPLFAGMSETSIVWMSHGDEVKKLPEGFHRIGFTADCGLAAVADEARKIYGLQFHPEVTHSEEGMAIFKNFLGLCGCKFEWKVADYVGSLEGRLRAQCEGRKVFLLVSGGVDSTVAFALLNRALGPERVLGLHIDNGLMRKNESADVLEFMNREGFRNLKVRDATDDFLKALDGIYAPEQKRKAIGDTFLTVKDDALEALHLDPREWLLAQGTIYPDTIESGATKDSAVIKTHHNRVGAIMELLEKGLVVEPLADLYKDEVRELGLLLGIPAKLIWRHPFPGPGLGVRLLCNREAGRTVDPKVTAKIQAQLAAEGLAGQGLGGEVLPIESVGVQGDGRTYAHPCLLKGPRDWDRADKISVALTNRVREVNRVVLEVGALPGGAYKSVQAQCDKPRLDLLREADDLCTRFLVSENLYASIWQMPVVLVPLEKAGRPVIVLRPVVSSEAMTARFAVLPFPLLDSLWDKLKAAGMGALLYDITHKPPGTIEWE